MNAATTARELAARVENAVVGSQHHNVRTMIDAWREGCERWGFDSPSAIGCVQAIAEEMHGVPLCAYKPRVGGWAIVSAHDHGGSFASDPAKTRALAWVECLEAAP